LILTVTASVLPAGQQIVAPFSLAEGGASGPANLKVREARVSQVVEFFRSNNAGVFDRLNRRVRLVFDVTRSWPTVDAAQNFLLQHSQLMPASGTVTATGEGDAGGFPLFFLPSAAIQIVEGAHFGATTRHHYQITAPAISTTAPT
jgi:hypothetical protein